MKKFFLSLLAVGLTLSANAQTEKLMATLQHGDKTTVYYGKDAFRNAYNDAADTLDVITLSGGEFNDVTDIGKSLTIYGAGFEPASSQGGQMTLLHSLQIRVNGVHVEGICLSGVLWIVGWNIDNQNVPVYGSEIVKCYTNEIVFNSDSYNSIIRQTRANTGIHGGVPGFPSSHLAKNLLISNCYIGGANLNRDPHNALDRFTDESTVSVDHCLIKAEENYGPQSIARYTNNITYHGFPSGAYADKNIFVSGGNPSYNEFAWWENNEHLWAADGEDGTYADEKTWELKKPGDYIGTDGTQVGLLGGVYGWNKIPSIPRITELNVDTKNVNNGTIKLTLKAEASNKE